jgi:hypothetical protein
MARKQFARYSFINTKGIKAFVYIKTVNAVSKINNVYLKRK